MEVVARKIKRGETLLLRDYKYWINYNFLVFSEPEQTQIKQLNERQQWFWKRMSFLIPPFWWGCFAVLRFHSKFKLIKNIFLSTMLIGVLTKVGLSSSERDMK